MADLNMTLAELEGIKSRIDDVLENSTYDKHADLRELHVDNKDSDQLFQLREVKTILRRLADIGASIEYLSRPVLRPAFYTKMKAGNTGQKRDTAIEAEA